MRVKVRPGGGGCPVEMPVLAVLAYALVAALLGSPGVARADGCRIEAVGAASAEWSAAREQPAQRGLTERDCVRIEIVVGDAQARVLFVAPDGRIAERVIEEPAELMPTIDALRVQGPSAPAPAPAPAPEQETATPRQ